MRRCGPPPQLSSRTVQPKWSSGCSFGTPGSKSSRLRARDVECETCSPTTTVRVSSCEGRQLERAAP
eukprot:1805949-Prymnesium_polylepis.1